MRAVITHDQLEVKDEVLYNSGSIDYYEIDTEFTSDWDNLTKYAIINGAEAVKIPVVANKVKVDRNTSGTYYIGFVGYTIDDDKKTFQISTNLQPIYFQIGAGELPAADPQDLPDPTTWEAYLNEIEAIVNGAENVNITSEKIEDTTYITTTDKTGTTTTTEIIDGKDAKINGVNTITIEGGENVTIEQEGSTLTISATDTTDYEELSNKPSINGVELSGNKTSSDLNIKQTYNKSDVGLGNVDNVRQYSVNNPPPYPVTSVNGNTGAVVIDTHDDLIPTQASSSNQLADKNFVNSTVGTATATFRGTYDSLTELEQVTADENDYGFVVDVDSAGNTVYNRYKYASGTWTFEYALNNSSFTAAQWEAIQSGITDDLVTKLQGIEAGAEVNIVEGLKIGNVTQQVSSKIIQINPDTTPMQGSNNVIDSNAVYEVEKLLPTDRESGESVDIDNAQPYKVLDLVADGKYQQNTTEGNNLFDGELELGNYSNTSGAKINDDATYRSKNYIEVSELSDYTLSVNGISQRFCLYFYDTDKTYLGNNLSLTTGSFSTPANTKYITFRCFANDFTSDFINLKIQINTGSTVKPYEPYTGGIPSPNPNYPQTITQVTSATWNRTGEQLFDKSTAIDGKRLGSDGMPFTDNDYCLSDFISIVPSTSCTYSRYSSGGGSAAVAFYDKNKTFISRILWGSSSFQTQTFTTPANASYLRITDFKTLKDSMKIQYGTTSTPYSPYQGQTIPIDLDGNEVCAVGTIKDKLLIDRYGNVALQKNVGKVVLNGSESYVFTSLQPTDTSLKSITVNISNKYPGAVYSLLTSHFVYAGNHSAISGATSECCWNNGGASDKRIGFITKEQTIENFKTWLSTHNTTVYYALATPQIIPLPKLSTLLSTIKGLNHIWVDTNLGTTDIEVEYVKDLSLDIPTKTSELTNDANFVKNTDYATNSTGGVFKSSTKFSTGMGTGENDGLLLCAVKTYNDYLNLSNYSFISKGTLANVLTAEIGTIETALTTLDEGSGV